MQLLEKSVCNKNINIDNWVIYNARFYPRPLNKAYFFTIHRMYGTYWNIGYEHEYLLLVLDTVLVKARFVWFKIKLNIAFASSILYLLHSVSRSLSLFSLIRVFFFSYS